MEHLRVGCAIIAGMVLLAMIVGGGYIGKGLADCITGRETIIETAIPEERIDGVIVREKEVLRSAAPVCPREGQTVVRMLASLLIGLTFALVFAAVLMGTDALGDGAAVMLGMLFGKTTPKMSGRLEQPIDIESRAVELDRQRALTDKEMAMAEYYGRRELPRQAPDFRAQLERANGNGHNGIGIGMR